MEKYYTVNELVSIFNISKATFYHQVKKNQDFFTKNSIKVKPEGRNSKPLTKYNQSVFDFLASIYAPSIEKIGGQEGPSPQRPPEAPETKEGETAGESIKNPPETKIDALEAEIKALKAQLEKAEEERAELIKQNGNLLLLLNQEKQEKQLLLPAPKKSIGERIRGLFKKH